MSLERRARILEVASSANYGVRDLTRMLKWKTAKLISLLRKMNEEKLIDLREGAHLRRGRPKKK